MHMQHLNFGIVSFTLYDMFTTGMNFQPHESKMFRNIPTIDIGKYVI